LRAIGVTRDRMGCSSWPARTAWCPCCRRAISARV